MDVNPVEYLLSKCVANARSVRAQCALAGFLGGGAGGRGVRVGFKGWATADVQVV